MDRGRTSEGPWNEPDDDSYESSEPDTYDEPPPRRRVRSDEQYNVPPPRRRTRDLNTSQQLPSKRTRDSEQYGPSRSSRPSIDRRTRNISNYDDEDDYAPPRRRVRRKRRSVWPALIGGCAIGLVVAVVAAAIVVFLAARSIQTGIPPIGGVPGISNGRTFTKTDTIPVTLSALSSVQVCDKIGNISIKADPNAPTATITTKKIVQAASQADATTEFGRIAVEVQPTGTINNPLACAQPTATPTVGNGTPTTGDQAGANPLIVNVTIPNSNGLLHTSPDSVDVQITLPMSLVSQSTTATATASPLLINVQDALGNISIDGMQGVFTIKGSSGNISVTHAILQNGSDVETGQGNVTFNGSLAQPNDPSASATYILHNEQGKIDVTLPANTNVTLDANSNVGSIQASDFSINVKGNGGPASYRGALNNTATTPAKAVLTLNVSIGDIVMHKGG